MTKFNSEAVSPRANWHYGAGVALAALAALATIWTTIVRDDGNGIGFFLVVGAIGVGGFAARFEPAGMARTMVGVAAMQALLGLAIATAPITAAMPGGSFKALLFSGAFAAVWLTSAALFWAAARAR